MEHLVGQSLGRYQLVALLGEGGMGAVFKARDVTLLRDVAVKVMHSRFARQPDFRKRFLQEAQTAANLDHPSIVEVHDFGQEQSRLYIVMEFIPGDNLSQMLQELTAKGQWIVLSEGVHLVREVCLTLDYAHGQGVLHRDVKPDNIMLKPKPAADPPYQPVLTDLGLAKLAEGGMITVEGTSMGTPAYMSPEQALGQETDARSDVYSLGILLYELAVGQLPFRARTITEAIRFHTKEPPPPPRSLRPELPESLERVILQALEKHPDGRFRDAEALARALDPVLAEMAASRDQPSVEEAAVGLTAFQPMERVAPRGPSPPLDRITVLHPDGTSHSVPMRPEGLTIGRATDNDLQVNHASVSRRHARIEFDGTNYQVTDLGSTNGTALGDTSLLPGMPEIWPPDERLRVGRVRLHLELAPERMTGKPAASPEEGTGVFGVDGELPEPSASRVGVFMETTDLSVEPGGSTSGSVTILNQSPVVDHFQIAVEGVPADWLPASLPAIRLMPGGQQQVTFTIQPPRSPKSRADQYPLTIQVASGDAPDQVAETSATLTVTAYHQFSLDLRPRRQRGLAEGTFQVEIRNQGNADLTFELQGRDPEEACLYTFEPPQLVVAPGEEGAAQLQVRPKVPLASETDRTYSFAVSARPVEPSDLSQRVQGEWVQSPPSFDLALRPETQSGEVEAVFEAEVTNRGSDSLTLQLEAGDPEDSCTYTFDPPQLVVPAAQARTAQLQVQPKAPESPTAPLPHAFTVTAQPAGAPGITRQARGEWLQVPAPRQRNRLLAIPVFLLGLLVTFGCGILAGQFTAEGLRLRDEAILFAGAVWIGGLILSFIIARKVWRGRKQTAP